MPHGANNAEIATGAHPRVGISDLLGARRRYANARRRARYWSGIPTFRPWMRSNETRSSRLWEKYELAMCDCKSWEAEIERLTGKPLPHYDPRKEFGAKFSLLMGKAPNSVLCDSYKEGVTTKPNES
jgi:hypothetical protein